ncbi:DUF6807 family protein [Kribbella sp. NPDC050820]|uniref:DUF6807 family protein n=1 Tax=Kribbella sp. NPDC050820 TaxID=3155408 RepID=UPI003408DE58
MTASRRDDALVPGGEAPPGGLTITREEGCSLRAEWNGTELFRDVYQPWDPPMESPKPYFHPLRQLNVDMVSLYRPHDHLWHTGLFWASPTWARRTSSVATATCATVTH